MHPLLLKFRHQFFSYDNTVLASLLDRTESQFGVEGRYKMLPELSLLAEYRFQNVGYDDNSVTVKDSDSSFFLFGAEYLPDEKLSLTAVGGIEDRNRDGAPDGSFGFGEVFAIYRYLPDSFVSGGINFGAQETDNVGAYLDEENLGIFANIQHAVTHSIFASGSVFYESSDLNARPGTGAVDISEDSLRAGLGLTYEASDNLAIILQYDLDDTSSDDPVRDQTRHRIGVSVRYTFGVR